MKTLAEVERVSGVALKVKLPQFKANVFPGSGSPALVLVAGGRPPNAQWLAQLCQGKDTWAVDKGIDVCLSAKIIPSLFIGDRDSASMNGILWARNNRVPSVVFPTEKNMTDLQIALRMVQESAKGPDVILAGVLGGRHDHFFANIFSMIWAEEEWGVQSRCAADEKEAIFLLKGPGSIEFTGVPAGTLVSTLTLSEKCTGVNLWGTKWPIENGTLNIRRPFAVSNIATGTKPGFSDIKNEVSFGVEMSSGWMGIYITATGIEEKGWI